MKKKLLGFCWDEVAITCLLLTKFPFGTEIRESQKNHEGFGTVTVGIHPNDFDLDPNKIPTGGVVQNCPMVTNINNVDSTTHYYHQPKRPI